MASFSINSYQRGSQINLKIKSWLLKRIWINFLFFFFFFYSNFQRCCFFSLCLCLCNCKPEWDKKRYPKSHPAECVLSLGLTPLPQGNLIHGNYWSNQGWHIERNILWHCVSDTVITGLFSLLWSEMKIQIFTSLQWQSDFQTVFNWATI